MVLRLLALICCISSEVLGFGPQNFGGFSGFYGNTADASLREASRKCKPQYPITSYDLKQLSLGTMPQEGNAKCLCACVMKNVGMLTDQHKYDASAAARLADKYIGITTADRIRSIKKLLYSCQKVNRQNVYGQQDCERADLILTCLSNNVISFNLIPTVSEYFAQRRDNNIVILKSNL